MDSFHCNITINRCGGPKYTWEPGPGALMVASSSSMAVHPPVRVPMDAGSSWGAQELVPRAHFALVPPPILRWWTRGPAGPGRAPWRSLGLLEFLRRLYRSLLGSFGVCFGVPGRHFCIHGSPMGVTGPSREGRDMLHRAQRLKSTEIIDFSDMTCSEKSRTAFF